MVLFKYIKLEEVVSNIDIFTFHYGPIQIGITVLKCIAELKFTFHYGPIQIYKVRRGCI